jgi:hemerythrin
MTVGSIEWDNSLVLGIKQIDEQHQQLVRLLGKSYNAIILDGPQTEFDLIVKELSDYSAYHLSTEERLMTEYGFPHMNSHLLEHAELSRNVKEFRDKCDSEDSSVAIDVLVFLRGWLINHILKTDRLYAEFLIGKGVA